MSQLSAEDFEELERVLETSGKASQAAQRTGGPLADQTNAAPPCRAQQSPMPSPTLPAAKRPHIAGHIASAQQGAAGVLPAHDPPHPHCHPAVHGSPHLGGPSAAYLAQARAAQCTGLPLHHQTAWNPPPQRTAPQPGSAAEPLPVVKAYNTGMCAIPEVPGPHQHELSGPQPSCVHAADVQQPDLPAREPCVPPGSATGEARAGGACPAPCSVAQQPHPSQHGHHTTQAPAAGRHQPHHIPPSAVAQPGHAYPSQLSPPHNPRVPSADRTGPSAAGPCSAAIVATAPTPHLAAHQQPTAHPVDGPQGRWPAAPAGAAPSRWQHQGPQEPKQPAPVARGASGGQQATACAQQVARQGLPAQRQQRNHALCVPPPPAAALVGIGRQHPHSGKGAGQQQPQRQKRPLETQDAAGSGAQQVLLPDRQQPQPQPQEAAQQPPQQQQLAAQCSQLPAPPYAPQRQEQTKQHAALVGQAQLPLQPPLPQQQPRWALAQHQLPPSASAPVQAVRTDARQDSCKAAWPPPLCTPPPQQQQQQDQQSHQDAGKHSNWLSAPSSAQIPLAQRHQQLPPAAPHQPLKPAASAQHGTAFHVGPIAPNPRADPACGTAGQRLPAHSTSSCDGASGAAARQATRAPPAMAPKVLPGPPAPQALTFAERCRPGGAAWEGAVDGHEAPGGLHPASRRADTKQCDASWQQPTPQPRGHRHPLPPPPLPPPPPQQQWPSAAIVALHPGPSLQGPQQQLWQPSGGGTAANAPTVPTASTACRPPDPPQSWPVPTQPPAPWPCRSMSALASAQAERPSPPKPTSAATAAPRCCEPQAHAGGAPPPTHNAEALGRVRASPSAPGLGPSPMAPCSRTVAGEAAAPGGLHCSFERLTGAENPVPGAGGSADVAERAACEAYRSDGGLGGGNGGGTLASVVKAPRLSAVVDASVAGGAAGGADGQGAGPAAAGNTVAPASTAGGGPTSSGSTCGGAAGGRRLPASLAPGYAATAAAAAGAQPGGGASGRAALPSIAEVRAAKAAAAGGGGAAAGAASKPKLPTLAYTGCVRYAVTAVEVDWLCGQLLEARPAMIGLDMEWRPQYVAGSAGNPTALVQICYPILPATPNADAVHTNAGRDCCCLLLHVIHSGITPRLRELLEAEQPRKVGVNISGDAGKLKRDYGVDMKGLLELDSVANERVLQVIDHVTVNTEYRSRWSLAALVEISLRRYLPKPNSIRCGNWERRPLDAAQQRYAALDAYAGLAVWAALTRLPYRNALSAAARPIGVQPDLAVEAAQGSAVAGGPAPPAEAASGTGLASSEGPASCGGASAAGGEGAAQGGGNAG